VDREETAIDCFPEKCLLSKNENYLYFRLKVYSINLIWVEKLLRLANTINSKSHSINSFSLSLIRMLLFAKNRFIVSTFFQNLIHDFGDSPLPSHLKSRFCWEAVADSIKRQSLLR